MPNIESIIDFLDPVNVFELSNDEGFKGTQLGRHINLYDESFPDITDADMVLVGCGESRGMFTEADYAAGPNAVRKEFYGLFHWHQDVKVADIGNVKTGSSLKDSYAALSAVVNELLLHNKRVVILGGSHDLTVAQYKAYAHMEQIIEAVCVDAKIDLDIESVMPAENFLMGMLTAEPNFIRNYNHIGFQSYFVHPDMLQTIDRLRFDCFRVGRVKENMEEMEPVIRNTHLFSFDIAAIQNSHAPANRTTPNGFNGEEACTLMQYAGMSPTVNSVGIYGFDPRLDVHDLTAKQVSHMLWYFMDGISKGKMEAAIEERNHYNEFNMAFAEIETSFLQSKKSGRWWMQLPDGKFIACSHRDYIAASRNDIPERWLRAIERS
ncbi:arginase [Segetibacter sp. 3557_3]|uniref:formimidoylglutamase n=1 Tax=Segetibacter sp. 3557_3 TaxID=2547429 RepID=UPI001058777F|nr:formimidoylglutamase [Segetibacter sp. 3557_3]TDH25127.1 arginase [Segetibacter sp. 3557_3]